MVRVVGVLLAGAGEEGEVVSRGEHVLQRHDALLPGYASRGGLVDRRGGVRTRARARAKARARVRLAGRRCNEESKSGKGAPSSFCFRGWNAPGASSDFFCGAGVRLRGEPARDAGVPAF